MLPYADTITLPRAWDMNPILQDVNVSLSTRQPRSEPEVPFRGASDGFNMSEIRLQLGTSQQYGKS